MIDCFGGLNWKIAPIFVNPNYAHLVTIQNKTFLKLYPFKIYKIWLRLVDSLDLIQDKAIENDTPSLSLKYYSAFMILNNCTLCLSMPCRNICVKIGSSFGCYSTGIKYCRRCEVYLFHDGYICPCCKRPLRTSPNNRKGKEKLRAKQVIIKEFKKIENNWEYEYFPKT